MMGQLLALALAWGVEADVHEDVIRVEGLGAAVCADGANGLNVVSAEEARARGLYVEPGQERVPLVAYHPDDEGPRRLWNHTEPKGLDAPENMTGPKVVQTSGPGAGAYLSETALVDGRYPEGDPRRYFDSSKVAGWVLPAGMLKAQGVGLGDLAAITYKGVTIWAQCYDVGPQQSKLLEMSVAACQQLGIDDCARNGGVPDGLSITILAGSRHFAAQEGKIRPWTAESAAAIAQLAHAYLGQAD